MTLLRTLLASSLVVIAGVLTLLIATDDFQAFTTETARRLEVLKHPPGVPPVVLQTQTGERVNLADLRGRWLLVDFIYTRCPSYCVALGSEFAQIQRALSAPIAAGKLTLLSISFDPSHDTPERLAAYQQRSRSYQKGWIVARPLTADGLDQLLRTFGVIVVKDGQGGYVHNTAIAVVDPQGRLVRILDQGFPKVVEQLMRQNLRESQHQSADSADVTG